jgi:hypothetical protein
MPTQILTWPVDIVQIVPNMGTIVCVYCQSYVIIIFTHVTFTFFANFLIKKYACKNYARIFVLEVTFRLGPDIDIHKF